MYIHTLEGAIKEFRKNFLVVGNVEANSLSTIPINKRASKPQIPLIACSNWYFVTKIVLTYCEKKWF